MTILHTFKVEGKDFYVVMDIAGRKYLKFDDELVRVYDRMN